MWDRDIDAGGARFSMAVGTIKQKRKRLRFWYMC